MGKLEIVAPRFYIIAVGLTTVSGFGVGAPPPAGESPDAVGQRLAAQAIIRLSKYDSFTTEFIRPWPKTAPSSRGGTSLPIVPTEWWNDEVPLAEANRSACIGTRVRIDQYTRPGTLIIAWNFPATSSGAIIIERKLEGHDKWETVARVPGETHTWTDTTLLPSAHAAYRLRTPVAGGLSRPSNVAGPRYVLPVKPIDIDALQLWEEDFGPNGDADHDGLSNREEWLAGTDILNPDTDGDGVPDGEDAVAIDPDLRYKRVETPHYAMIDLGPGNVLAMNDHGDVLIYGEYPKEGDRPAAKEKTYRLWSAGRNIPLPNDAGLHPEFLGPDGTVVGEYRDGIFLWHKDEGLTAIGFAALLPPGTGKNTRGQVRVLAQANDHDLLLEVKSDSFLARTFYIDGNSHVLGDVIDTRALTAVKSTQVAYSLQAVGLGPGGRPLITVQEFHYHLAIVVTNTGKTLQQIPADACQYQLYGGTYIPGTYGTGTFANPTATQPPRWQVKSINQMPDPLLVLTHSLDETNVLLYQNGEFKPKVFLADPRTLEPVKEFKTINNFGVGITLK